jgi:hypothetical protein
MPIDLMITVSLLGGMRSSPVRTEGLFELLGDPNRPDQEIDRALEECGPIALDAMAKQKKNPSTDEQGQTRAPKRGTGENDSRQDHGNSGAVQDFVRPIRVFVVVLRQVS